MWDQGIIWHLPPENSNFDTNDTWLVYCLEEVGNSQASAGAVPATASVTFHVFKVLFDITHLCLI